ncbi:hypothetical protein NPIL_488341 [Nephila pilipes]|uniref:Uncharacterized protein n=1 Tax=Nephila pilipes TaxID=299642 RepID=A0A8X6P4A5_NEPPI|nr:hypothetical protein NPIL_488341 [Nephila pilipes]
MTAAAATQTRVNYPGLPEIPGLLEEKKTVRVEASPIRTTTGAIKGSAAVEVPSIASSSPSWSRIQELLKIHDSALHSAVVRDLSDRKSGYMNVDLDTESELTTRHRKKHRGTVIYDLDLQRHCQGRLRVSLGINWKTCPIRWKKKNFRSGI